MKGKNIIRFVGLSIFILYTTLYITQALGYYEYSNRKTNRLTEDAVQQFEKDLESGKEIKASDYMKKDNDYHNKLSKMGLSISKIIEKSFDGMMKFIFHQIDDAMREE